VDIGGGSTEFALGSSGRLEATGSIPVGAVVLVEKHVRNDPPAPEEAEAMEEAVRGFGFGILPGVDPSVSLLCVGGTATTLAALDLGLDRYDPIRVDGVELERETVERWFERLYAMTAVHRREFMAVDPERADILPAGLLILKTVMALTGMQKLRVSDRGLRFGIALREFGLVPSI
jgi:exopolyphosphatase/guanosine-5'-triphosphate,3'-diphosphate pyrophosphatase